MFPLTHGISSISPPHTSTSCRMQDPRVEYILNFVRRRPDREHCHSTATVSPSLARAQPPGHCSRHAMAAPHTHCHSTPSDEALGPIAFSHTRTTCHVMVAPPHRALLQRCTRGAAVNNLRLLTAAPHLPPPDSSRHSRPPPRPPLPATLSPASLTATSFSTPFSVRPLLRPLCPHTYPVLVLLLAAVSSTHAPPPRRCLIPRRHRGSGPAGCGQPL